MAKITAEFLSGLKFQGMSLAYHLYPRTSKGLVEATEELDDGLRQLAAAINAEVERKEEDA
jgi:hypothetical protein